MYCIHILIYTFKDKKITSNKYKYNNHHVMVYIVIDMIQC